MSKFIFLPTFTKKSDITFHKKSDFPDLKLSSEETIQYSYVFKETPNSNLHQISIRSDYTFTDKNTQYFCRFDIVSPFEINKYVINLTKEDFEELSNVHLQNCKEEFTFSELLSPDNIKLKVDNDNVNSEYIALMLVDFRTIQNSIKN